MVTKTRVSLIRFDADSLRSGVGWCGQFKMAAAPLVYQGMMKVLCGQSKCSFYKPTSSRCRNAWHHLSRFVLRGVLKTSTFGGPLSTALPGQSASAAYLNRLQSKCLSNPFETAEFQEQSDQQWRHDSKCSSYPCCVDWNRYEPYTMLSFSWTVPGWIEPCCNQCCTS